MPRNAADGAANGRKFTIHQEAQAAEQAKAVGAEFTACHFEGRCDPFGDVADHQTALASALSIPAL